MAKVSALKLKLHKYLQATVAPSTRKAYRANHRSYKKFCTKKRLKAYKESSI